MAGGTDQRSWHWRVNSITPSQLAEPGGGHQANPHRWSTRLRVIVDRRDPNSPVSTLTAVHLDRGRAGSPEDRGARTSPAQYRRDR